jgi:AcrR family transcriptional regulator
MAKPPARRSGSGKTGARQKAVQPAGSAAAPDRREAILAAALDVFAESGFAPSRLDDVAARAGVAKGTIYLYFPSKQALFEALVQTSIGGPIGAIGDAMLASDRPTTDLLRMLFSRVRTEILGTRRREVARLVLSEAGRFPELAAFYHREVVGRGMALIRAIARRGVERGEIASDALERFPQLAAAPLGVALLWTSFFDALEPLDVEGMFDAHVEMLMRGLQGDRR